MAKVLSISYGQFKNNELCGVLGMVEQVLAATANGLSTSIGKNFSDALQGCAAVLDKASSANLSLEFLDDACDRVWRTLMAQIRVDEKHFNEDRVNAGAAVSDVLDEFGDLTGLDYEDEYTAMGQAIEKLEAISAETLEMALVADIVKALRTTYNVFMSSYRAAQEKQLVFDAHVVKLRKQLVISWEALSSMLEIMAVQDHEIAEAIHRINDILCEAKIRYQHIDGAELTNDML